MSNEMDIYAELDNFVEENEGQVILTDVAKHFADYGYQYAVEKAFDILSQMLYTKRDDEHPAQHYTRTVESMGEFVSQTDFLNQFKQKMQ